MKTKLSIFAAVAVFAILALPLSLVAQQQQEQSGKLPHYKLTILPTLGGTFANGWGVNNQGWVAGHSTLLGDQVSHAFFWRSGVITDLGTLGGPNSNNALSGDPVNDRGAVSGFSDTSTPDPNGEDFCGLGTNLICLPFVWQKGVMTALPLLGGNNGQAGGINNRGQIVGASETPNSDPCSVLPLQLEGVIWENGTVQELSPLPGDPDGFAMAINDRGEVAGATGCVPGIVHAVLWRHGTPINLGSLGGVAGNFAGNINNKGQVVGESDLPGDTLHHAFLWQNDVMSDLGSLPGLPTSAAGGINNNGQVVGYSQDANSDDSTSVAWIWQDGVLTDLNTLIPPGSPLFLMEALNINDRGEVAGFGSLSNGEVLGFLLTPCDENHPGVESCDYNLVEPNAVHSAVPAMHETLGPVPNPAPWRRSTRFHFPSRSPRN